MSKQRMFIGLILVVILGLLFYRFSYLLNGKGVVIVKNDASEPKENNSGKGEGKAAEKPEEPKLVAMTAEKQTLNGIVVTIAKKERLAGAISATGKVEVNGDKIAHVSSRISGKISSVNASLGDSISSNQVLAMLDSVELGEALNRYRQSKTKLLLAKNNLDRVKTLVDKKIAARKDILQAETDYQMTLTELHTDEERLTLYGLSAVDLDKIEHKRQLLPLRAPISGVITEKHAIVGELADPSKSLYTIADLSTVWVMVYVNEKDLAKVHKGQSAIVTVVAFPELRFAGRINHIADVMDEATRTVKARIEVSNPGRKLKPEMFATVELALSVDTPPVLAISEDAVQELEGKKILFVTKNGTEFEPRSIDLGRISGGKVEVTGGLKEGERYASKGGFLLKSELKKGELGE